jgi:hypothetical protein
MAVKETSTILWDASKNAYVVTDDNSTYTGFSNGKVAIAVPTGVSNQENKAKGYVDNYKYYIWYQGHLYAGSATNTYITTDKQVKKETSSSSNALDQKTYEYKTEQVNAYRIIEFTGLELEQFSSTKSDIAQLSLIVDDQENQSKFHSGSNVSASGTTESGITEDKDDFQILIYQNGSEASE